MDLDEQLKLGHLLLEERTCRVCGERKNLLQSFYRVHKNVKLLSSYSYEIIGTVPAGSAEHAKQALDIATKYQPKLTRYERQQIYLKDHKNTKQANF